MFFYIHDKCPINALKEVTQGVFLDKGWSKHKDIWYKGYSTDCKLSESLYDIIQGYEPRGKWCVIYNKEVYHPTFRGFPMYITEDDALTNIKFDGSSTCLYTEDEPDVESILSMEEASMIIGDILLENTINFYKYNNIPEMNVLFSAGLDTLTSWAVFDHYTKNYNLTAYLPKEGEYTLHKFLGRIREYESDLVDKVSNDYWGYDVSSCFKKTNWYLTGYYAEVIQFRDGEAINALANYQGKKIEQVANETDYLYWFLKRPNIVERYKNSNLQFATEKHLKDYLWSTLFYDHQMWHIDNNMTFNPFFDIRIPKTVYRMSIDDITRNAVTGQIQKNIVNRFNPQLLSLCSDYKNEGDIWGNFIKNWPTIKLDPKVKINIR